jgi:hypothetical protein
MLVIKCIWSDQYLEFIGDLIEHVPSIVKVYSRLADNPQKYVCKYIKISNWS